MMMEEDVWKIEQEKMLAKVRPDLKRALKSLESALHWLHETHEYESEMLDEVCEDIQDNIQVLEGFTLE